MSVTIELSEDQQNQLNKKAAELNLSCEELAAVAVRDLLTRRDERFHKLLNRVIDENEELYKRLG